MDPISNAIAYPVSTVVGAASFLVSPWVLAYRWKRTPRARRLLDGFQRRFTGRPDWSWLRLWHLMVPLVVITAANIAFQVSTLHCYDDSLAILASGQAALHGHDPFDAAFCGGGPGQIPYGFAEVALNALGALSGNVLGMWLVWQTLALAVVPLVWALGGEDRRYLSALVATSVLYLPNIATNIGVENAIVPVAILLMLCSLLPGARRRRILQAVSAFLSTARFPALFPLLGASAPVRRGRAIQTALVLGTFLLAVAVSYLLWGWDAIGIVYLGQFSRSPDESLNLFAVLLHEGWLHPSLVSAGVQGVGLLAIVLVVNARRYTATAAVALPLLGVMALSQYLTFHFVVWIVPVLLLGGKVQRWLYVYALLAWLDETILLGYLGQVQGVWWPYEAAGALLAAILVYLFATILRAEETRRRTVAPAPLP
jgi:hypothetical protein